MVRRNAASALRNAMDKETIAATQEDESPYTTSSMRRVARRASPAIGRNREELDARQKSLQPYLGK